MATWFSHSWSTPPPPLTGECKNCTEEGFSSPKSYTCSDCSADLCCYHGQKHRKDHHDHHVIDSDNNSSTLNHQQGGGFVFSPPPGSATTSSSIFGSSNTMSTNNHGTSSSIFGSSFGSTSGFSTFSASPFGSSSLSQRDLETIQENTKQQNQEIVAKFDGNNEANLIEFIGQRAQYPILNDCKLILVGEPCGKSSFVKRLITDEFNTGYVATIGVEVSMKEFETTHGQFKFRIWDTAGQEKFGGLRDGYYIGGNCAIIMFDGKSFRSVPNWHRDIVRVCDNIPIVLCANMVDLLSEEERANLREKAILFCHRKQLLNYFELSNKNGLNLEDPLEYLAKALSKNIELSFISKLKKERENSFQHNLQKTLMTTDTNISTE